MSFDREIIEARLSLGWIGPSDMPKVAWEALEAGLDGPAIRRLGALAFDSPTYFDVRDIIPRAMQEMGLVELTPGVAALRIARNRAKEILQRGEDPLRRTREFERLWIDAGYPRELRSIGTLDDEVYIASGCQSDDAIRKWIIERLRELISSEGMNPQNDS